ncbi:phosphoenolpyruvate carboxykinase (ATP) 2 [Glycine max]|nr:phosphoenolpyruvate carboxykinase (ATP) 2 [Glycine max]|eukprot:XP_014617104.1 uncharacterized protein LOC106794362 [Glycine max]
MDDEAIKLSGSNRRPHSEITKNSKRGNAKANMETDNLDSVQEPKSETQLNTVPRKRGRKPNSLMNVEEAYDHSWISQETKPGKSANPERLKSENIAKAVQSRRTQNIGTDFLANDTSKVHEALASKPKADENTNTASVNNNYPDAGAISTMLAEKMQKHGANGWLVNTGRSGGSYGCGNRIKLSYMRKIIDAIHSGSLLDAKYKKTEIFGLESPNKVEGVPSEILEPENTWLDKQAYKDTLLELAGLFNKIFETFTIGENNQMIEEILAAGPIIGDA